jgi:hypothetical protein
LEFHLVSRLRDDASLLYLYQVEKTEKKGRPKTFDRKIDVGNLDYNCMEKLESYEEEGELYSLIAHSKALQCNIQLVIRNTLYPKGTQTLFFYGHKNERERCHPILPNKVSNGILLSRQQTVYQPRSLAGKGYHRLDFAFNASFAAVNEAKMMMKENDIPFSMDTLKNLMDNSYILNIFFEPSGFKPNRKINTKLI